MTAVIKPIWKMCIQACCACVFFVSAGAFGHHGAVTNMILYQADEIVEFEGEMTEVFWRNPHTRGRLKVVDESGNEKLYLVELGPSPRTFEARGFKAEDFIGEVKVAGYISRRSEDEIGATNVLLPNGTEIMAFSIEERRWTSEPSVTTNTTTGSGNISGQGGSDGSIFQNWAVDYSTWVEPEEDLSREWMSELARTINAEYDPIADNIELNECRQGMPDAMFDPVPMQIVDLGDRITIEITEYNTFRTIYMDGATSPEPVASSTGYSTGRWVGDTLVVTTTHINWPRWTEWGMPLSDQASVLETFSVSGDGNILNISVTLVDPVMYTRPFTIERTRVWTPAAEIPPYDCVVDWEG